MTKNKTYDVVVRMSSSEEFTVEAKNKRQAVKRAMEIANDILGGDCIDVFEVTEVKG